MQNEMVAFQSSSQLKSHCNNTINLQLPSYKSRSLHCNNPTNLQYVPALSLSALPVIINVPLQTHSKFATAL